MSSDILGSFYNYLKYISYMQLLYELIVNKLGLLSSKEAQSLSLCAEEE